MTFDIRVISLVDSPRRAAIREIVSRHGVEFDFEDAFDARALDAQACSAMTDAARVIARYGRPLSRGEVGCFISHVRVWEKIVRSGRAAVVLEDDAMLDHALFERLLSIPGEVLSDHADIVLLGRSKLSRDRAALAYLYEPLKRARRIGGLRIGVPFKQWTSGSVGYWISVDGARKALEHARGPVAALLDDWPWHRDHGGLRIAELRPYAVWEAFETMPSAIEAGRAALSSRRHGAREWLLKPLRVLRAVFRWLIVATLTLTASRGRLFARHG
ncbi:glycosyltransferase family 25 protein [Burkholderia latens]|uniref:Glycosyltransferase family 25 protein n=1 Tax=Burkholderia latens TaxID=488446 RepID=A0A6H9SXN2_9BURK|nr:glycosyltransferase family 25 protein [Burkholderia latens]KAB0640065.1 glycosyltransferase family 25 protein [Burkholderia latens]VWB81254.1 LPS glycosyltransferase [Burkholderia latens]